MFQEGGYLQALKGGSCPVLGNELSRETHCVVKARDFIRKEHPGGEQKGKGTQEDSSLTWLAVLGFM